LGSDFAGWPDWLVVVVFRRANLLSGRFVILQVVVVVVVASAFAAAANPQSTPKPTGSSTPSFMHAYT